MLSLRHLKYLPSIRLAALSTLKSDFSRSKIIATIGPSTDNTTVLHEAYKAGMRIARFNCAHSTHEEMEERLQQLQQLDIPHNDVAVMLDLQGPKLRIGCFSKSYQTHITTGDKNHSHLYINHPQLTSLPLGQRLYMADIALTVVAYGEDNSSILCLVDAGGVLCNRQAVSVPQSASTLPILSAKDMDDIKFGLLHQVDIICVSAIHKAEDFSIVRNHITEHCTHGSVPLVVAKIETHGAVDNCSAIVRAADGIMVARGNLSAEYPLPRVISIQQQLMRMCHSAGKPVIIATNVLESMVQHIQPTQAECSDISHALTEGCTCMMLGKETAVGRFPISAIAMLKDIIDETEKGHLTDYRTNRCAASSPAMSLHDEVAKSIVATAYTTFATCILLIGNHGVDMAVHLAKFHPTIPVLCFVKDISTAKRLQLYESIVPVQWSQHLKYHGLPDALEIAKHMHYCRIHDVAIVVGEERKGKHELDVIKVEIVTA